MKFTETDSNQKEVDILNRNNECVLPCTTGEILQEGQPSATAVFKACADLRTRRRRTTRTTVHDRRTPSRSQTDARCRTPFSTDAYAADAPARRRPWRRTRMDGARIGGTHDNSEDGCQTQLSTRVTVDAVPNASHAGIKRSQDSSQR